MQLRRLSPVWWPALVGLLSLAITAWLWQHEHASQQRHLRDNFDFALRQAVTRIEQRVSSYEQMLRGTRGLFESSDEVTAADFDNYVDALAGGADFSGLRSLAYAPLGANRQTAVVAVAAPASEHASALQGRDLLADADLREAMLRARDTGRAAITRRLWVPAAAAGAVEPAFMLFMPVFERRRPADTVALRQARLVGWIGASFRVRDVMSSLYGEGLPGIDVLVYDGVRMGDDTRLFPQLAGTQLPAAAHEAQEYIGFAGRSWTVQVRSRDGFAHAGAVDVVRGIAIAGVAFSALLALLTWQLVTARERATSAARVMTRRLRDSAEQYRRIVDTADEGIWMLDATGRTSFSNPKLQALLGCSAAQLAGRPCSDFMDADDCAALAAGTVQQRELRLRRHDGSVLWATLSTSTVTDGEGRPAGQLAMVTDITARRQADERRAALEAQLLQSQKMEAIGTLAGGIAHDFNNILAATLGQVALLQQELADHPDAHARLARIRQASERARSLVQQIVTFSRQGPRQAQALLVQPLQPLLQETAALLRSTLPAQVELQLLLPPEPLHVAADAAQMQQVLMNLCTNAWHALQGSSGHIVVGLERCAVAPGAVAGLPAGAYAHLWVQDDGCGMDDETRQRVFEPFFTTKPVGQGTGLGLSVVHGVVAAHHGAITVRGAPGQGSCFDLYLPLAPAPQPAGVPVPAAAAPRGRGEHLLYVDDDPVMVALACELLQRQGWQVSGESDPRAALAQLQAGPVDWDLLITDFNMPEISGLDLARAAARHQPGLPVILTSGFVSEALRAEVAQAGVVAVVQKEFTQEQLLPAVQAALAARRPAAATVSAEPAAPA